MGFNINRHGIVFVLAIAITFWKVSQNGHHFFPNQNGGTGLFGNVFSRGGDGFDSDEASHDWTLVKAALQKRFAPHVHEIEIYDSRSNAGVGGRMLTVMKRPSAVLCKDQCNSLTSPPVVLATIHEKYVNEGLYGDNSSKKKGFYAPKRAGGNPSSSVPGHPKSAAEKRKQRMANLSKKTQYARDDRMRPQRSMKSIILSVFDWMLRIFSPGYEHGYSELDEVQMSAQYDREISQHNHRNLYNSEYEVYRKPDVPKGPSRGKAAKAFGAHQRGPGIAARSRRNSDGSLKHGEHHQTSLSMQLHMHLVDVTCVLEAVKISAIATHPQDNGASVPISSESNSLEEINDEAAGQSETNVESHDGMKEQYVNSDSDASPLATSPLIVALQNQPNTSQFIRDSLSRAQKPNLTRRAQKQLVQDTFVIDNTGHRHSNFDILRSRGIEFPLGNAALPTCSEIHTQWIHASESSSYLQHLKPLFLTSTLPPVFDTTQLDSPAFLETELAQVLYDLLVDIHSLALADILDPAGNRIVRSNKLMVAADAEFKSGISAEDEAAPLKISLSQDGEKEVLDLSEVAGTSPETGIPVETSTGDEDTGIQEEILEPKVAETIDDTNDETSTEDTVNPVEDPQKSADIGEGTSLLGNNDREQVIVEDTEDDVVATATRNEVLPPPDEAEEDVAVPHVEKKLQADEVDSAYIEKFEL